MISRLTLSAALFAVLATATLSFAAEAQHAQRPATAARSAAVAAPVIVMPQVEVIGRRPR